MPHLCQTDRCTKAWRLLLQYFHGQVPRRARSLVTWCGVCAVHQVHQTGTTRCLRRLMSKLLSFSQPLARKPLFSLFVEWKGSHLPLQTALHASPTARNSVFLISASLVLISAFPAHSTAFFSSSFYLILIVIFIKWHVLKCKWDFPYDLMTQLSSILMWLAVDRMWSLL